MVFGIGKKKESKDMDEAALTAELLRIYTYHILHDSEPEPAGLQGAWAKLDNVEAIVASCFQPGKNRVTPEERIKQVIQKNGKVPKNFQIPNPVGKLSRSEAKERIIQMHKDAGEQEPQDAKLEATLNKHERKPLEMLCDECERRIKEHVARKKEAEEAREQEERDMRAEEEPAAPHDDAAAAAQPQPQLHAPPQHMQQQQHQQPPPPLQHPQHPQHPSLGVDTYDHSADQTPLVPVTDEDRLSTSQLDDARSGAGGPTSAPNRRASVGPHGRRPPAAVSSPRGFGGGFPDGPPSPTGTAQSPAQTGFKRGRSASVVSSAAGDEGGFEQRSRTPLRGGGQGKKALGGRRHSTVIDLQRQYEERSKVQQDDYNSLYQEVQMLKHTINEQVDTHRKLIDLQRGQQEFLQRYLMSVERENGAMAAEAQLLRHQYGTALEQWQSAHTSAIRDATGSPVHIPRSPTRARGVVTWLEALHMQEYAEVFVANEIDFQSLVLLTETDLIRMGIQALGPRKTLLRGIAELARQQLDESPRAKSRARVTQALGHTSPYPLAPDVDPAGRAGSASPQGALIHAASPSQWKAHVDSTTGRAYYYNGMTGESKWEIPEQMELGDDFADLL